MWGRRRQPVDEEKRVVKDAERSRKRTMDRAVRLLAAKPRSVAELRERLLEKLWTDHEIVESVLDKLKEYKYLDDAQYARDAVASKLRQKPQGKRSIQFAMSRKKLDRETIDKAVETAFENVAESDLLDAAIEKRIRLKGVPQTLEEKKKLFDFLLRRGFDYGSIRDRVRAIIDIDAGNIDEE